MSQPRKYSPSDFNECVRLLIGTYSLNRVSSPPGSVAKEYFEALISNKDAHTFVYPIGKRIYAVCTGIVKEEENGIPEKRFYPEDIYSDSHIQKRLKLEEKLIEFAARVLKEMSIRFPLTDNDYIWKRSSAFKKLGFDPISKKKSRIDKEYESIMQRWESEKNEIKESRSVKLPRLFGREKIAIGATYRRIQLSVKQLGNLKITSGLIVVADLFSLGGHLQKPLAYQFPVGKFPVELIIANNYVTAVILKFNIGRDKNGVICRLVTEFGFFKGSLAEFKMIS